MNLTTLVIKGKQFSIYPLNIVELEKRLKEKLGLIVIESGDNYKTLGENNYGPFFMRDSGYSIRISRMSLEIKLNGIRNAVKLIDMNGKDINILGILSVLKMTTNSENHIRIIIYKGSNYIVEYEYHSTLVHPEQYIEKLILNYKGRPVF